MKARRPAGVLSGPAPTRHQVRMVPLVVEQLDGGRWKISLLKAPTTGWVVGRPDEVTRAIRQAFVEAQIVAYADWRHASYDEPDAPRHRRAKPIARSARRCDVYDASMWKRDPDNPAIWISPKGLRYPEGRQVVQRVKAQLEARGVNLDKPWSRPLQETA